MPERIPLEMPPGDADAITALARDIRSAARCLAAVDVRISGPATDTAGWLGEDATAAAAQILGVVGLVRDAHDAVTPAADRLSAHAEYLLETRSRIRALEREQDEQFTEAYRRWYALPDLQAQLMVGGPGVRAIVAGVEAGEASRRRRHHALLEDAEEDAAETARVLALSCAAVGGRGRSGDADRVVAYLAAQLPGWGDRELIRRARTLAAEFGTLLRTDQREKLARDALPYAGSAAFADAFLSRLGVLGTRDTLEVLGDGHLGPGSALARFMAQAIGASSPETVPGVRAVLRAEYATPDDRDARMDLAVLGMGAVLAAGLALGSRGVDPRTAALWGGQIALRDHRLGGTAAQRAEADGGDVEPVDPLAMVVEVLTAAGNPTPAASFLAAPPVWDVLLSRAWQDHAAALGRLTPLAAGAPGVLGEAVVRGALEALGNGLQDGDVHGWRAERATADELLPALADTLARHVSVAGEALDVGVDGGLRPGDEPMLRGLAYLTTDRQAAAVVEAALQRWVAGRPAPFSAAGAVQRFPAIVVPNAYLAVQEYGQEVAHALGELALEQRADDRAFLWNMTVGLVAGLAPGPWGLAAGAIADYVAMGLDLDGTWEPGPPQDLHFAAHPVDPGTLTGLTEDDWMRVYAMAHLAEDSFEGTRQALGTVDVPTSPPTHWWDPLRAMMAPGPADVIDLVHHDRAHVPPIR